MKPASDNSPNSNSGPESDGAATDRSSDDPAHHETTVVLRGETMPDQARQLSSNDSSQRKDEGGVEAGGQAATIVVRGEAVRDPPPSADKGSPSKDNDSLKDKGKDASAKDKESSSKEKEKPRKEVSESKSKIRSRLPALDDDPDVGAQKEQIVVRDGKADLAFTGTLVASAAPPSAPKGKWQEYRIYETTAGKHVFSKVGRSVFVEDQDTHEAEVFDPAPSSVPSQLLRSARDLTRSRPLTWMDAAVEFFGYDPLAKALYRKLGGQFEEHIS